MIDLNEYLKMIGLNGWTPEKNLEFLSTLISNHLQTFGYQNTYLYLEGKKAIDDRLPGDISLDAVFDMFVKQRQFGYCFQNTELLFGVLNQMGFNVQRHLARVYNQSLDDINFEQADKKAFDHEVLVVIIAESQYLLDTGFANNSLRGPLIVRLGEQRIGPNNYRLSQQDNDWLIEMQIKDNQWICLYKVAGTASNLEEISDANTRLFTSTDRIPIRDDFNKIACVTPDKRKFMVRFSDGTMFFKSFQNGKLYRECTLESDIEFEKLAERKFSVKL